MTLISKAALRGLAAAAALALGSFGAQAGTWTFSQSFGANGTISGQFTGEDTINPDGFINYDDGEVSALTLNYTGSLGNLSFSSSTPHFIVSAFAWDMSESTGLSNPMTGFDILATPASGVGNSLWWQAGIGLGFDSDGINAAGSLNIFDTAPGAQVTTTSLVDIAPVNAVPEPESYLMMALGLAGIAAAKRRKAA